jgi:thiol-disulfide isomerase/thioredoxin
MLALALAACKPTAATPKPAGEHVHPPVKHEAEADAPELDGAIAWLGVDRPLTIADLRGQVVVLDFWTYCCINCMHVLPLLAELERELAGQPFAVVGVHSAKFDGERDPARILAAMRRHGVEHPVAVDSDLAIWRRYDVHGWPTLVVIRPNGKIAGYAPGEPDPQLLRRAVRAVLEEARADGSLARAPLSFKPVAKTSRGPLAFPGKVAALPDGGLVVADSGHHRVLGLGPDGEVRWTAGSGLRGWADGPFAAAAFADPQGLAPTPDGEAVYVADARNHAVRRIDLSAKTVETVAGTGALGGEPLPEGPLPARRAALRSPWDVALSADGEILYIALAGSHQIAALDVARGELRRLSGSGRESIVDGEPDDAAFAQPSGLALHRRTLYVADSEVSGVRAVDVEGGRARTLVGTGLFDFGDRDGPLEGARLQHPLHVLVEAGGTAVLVADTYNHKLKRIDLAADAISTFYAGAGELALHEPGGLARLKSGELVVADTNADRLLRVSRDGKTAAVFAVAGAPPPLVGSSGPQGMSEATPLTNTLQMAGPPLAGIVELSTTLVAPAGHELSDGAPLDLELRTAPGALPRLSYHGTVDGGPTRRITARFDLGPAPPKTLDLELRTAVCDAAEHRYCAPIRNRFALDLPAGLASAPGSIDQVLKASVEVPLKLAR